MTINAMQSKYIVYKQKCLDWKFILYCCNYCAIMRI